jgi:oligoendopeptidase F
MNLKGNSVENLNTSFNALETFLGDQTTLEKVRELLKHGTVSEEQRIVLNQIEKTLKCYIVESSSAKALRESMMKKEGALQKSRNNLKTQYTDKDGNVVDTTPTVIRTKMRSDPVESVRKSCWEMLRKNGPFLLDNGFCDIIKERNRFARELGFEDFYDLKVTNAEGFSKKKCFEMLDGLEHATKPLLDKALERLKKEKGEDATKPWNTGFALSGELTKLTDPYYPFEYAPEVWGRSFSKMNIKYKGATMRLDLCDRKGKYPNGFCHWPTAPYKTQDDTFIPSETNFTSLATPDEIGSGNTALTTLMHEGGHAAHFSNIVQGSPLFSQERAPFSVALAETQSMFLDALCEDASWQARYAKNRKGETIPWELIERSIKERHPYKVFQLRGMIAVPYFEKALYEMDEKDLTPENVLKVADEVEMKIQGGLAGRPLMSVPHILADESSCYYHGYVFAEMAVHQTREYFFKTGDGTIVDNPRVGKELIENYWVHGSGNPGFLGLVNNLTGSPLKHDAWVKELGVEVEDLLKEEKAEYEKALASASSSSKDEIDLEMRAIFVHGDDVISDSKESGFVEACEKFRGWIYQEWPKTKSMA